MTFNHVHKHLNRGRGVLLYFFLVLTCFLPFKGHGEGAGLFSAQSLGVEGRKLSVIPTDLDGRGLAEIVVLNKTGLYPNEKRWISIFSADTSGQYCAAARQRWEVDHAATMFDVGDVAPSPAKEIFYLTSRGISYYPQDEDGNFSTTPHNLISFPTITVFPTAGSLPCARLIADWSNIMGIKLFPLTKTFGAAILMKLVEEGQLNLQDEMAGILKKR
jgi:hypothetical protein